MNRFILTITLSALLALSGCNKNGESSALLGGGNGSDSSGMFVGVIEKNAYNIDEKRVYIKRESLQPLEKYKPFSPNQGFVDNGSKEDIDRIEQYRNLYWSVAPLDYEVLAFDFLDGYADETDTFKKKDMLNANKAKLDAIYNARSTNKYLSIRTRGVDILNYSEEKKGFVVNTARGRHSITTGLAMDGNTIQKLLLLKPTPHMSSQVWTYSSIGFPNTEIVYIPKNEDEARMIQSELSAPDAADNLEKFSLGRAVAAWSNDTSSSASVMIDGLAVVNTKTGKVIFTISKKEMGDKEEVGCEFASAHNFKYCDDK